MLRSSPELVQSVSRSRWYAYALAVGGVSNVRNDVFGMFAPSDDLKSNDGGVREWTANSNHFPLVVADREGTVMVYHWRTVSLQVTVPRPHSSRATPIWRCCWGLLTIIRLLLTIIRLGTANHNKAGDC